MGRLFWKFFFFIWLAQLTAIVGVSGAFWLKHQSERGGVDVTVESAPEHHDRARFAPEQRPEDGAVIPPAAMPPPHGGRMRPEPGGEISKTFVPAMTGLVASLLFAALMAWYMSQPIRRLRDAFQQLAKGEWHTRIGASVGRRRDELADLSHDFDRMADQLTGALQGQRRLLHDVSHELRSPLARLQAAIGLARQQPDRIEDYMLRMEREAMRMDKLVGELLTLSRLEAGALVGMETVHVDELLSELIDNTHFEAQANHKRFEADVDLAGLSDTCLQGRFELLYRACENVLRNAIRHTLPDTRVTLKVSQETDVLHILIQDEGSGVPAQHLPHIFDPFFRAPDDGQQSEGYGLGLAIAHRVILAHSGTIVAKNRIAGGLSVEITLPVMSA